MSTKFVLNETYYFGNGARSELAGEIQKRGFKKVFLVSDKSLVDAGVTKKVEEELEKGILKEIQLSDFKMQHDFDFIWEKGSIYSGKYCEVCEELA